MAPNVYILINAVLTICICLFDQVLSAPVNRLDVFISRKELKRFFPGYNIKNFYIIRKGVVDNLVESQVIRHLSVIAPTIHSLEIRFQSKQKLYYKLHMSSSDREMMKQPSATIRSSGPVPRKARPFKVRFPCTGDKTGDAFLTIKMEFMTPSRKKTVRFILKLKRRCVKAKEAVQAVEQVEKDNYTCGKKCDKNSVLVRFCISDFAIRARVEKRSIGKNGRLRYRIRVTKYYKTGKMPITKSKKHYIEMRGRDITCKCKFLQPRRTYLILGKEDKRIKTLFLDNYTYAIEWSQGGKKLAKLHKKKATCPAKLTTVWHV